MYVKNTKGRKNVKTIWRKAIIPIIMGACLMGCGNNQIRDERKTMNLNELGEIAVCIREEGSGTRQTFTESVVDSKDISEKCYEANGNDEVVEYVSENENAVGYVSKGTPLDGGQCYVVETDKKITRPFYMVYIGKLNDVENDFFRYIQSAGQDKAESFLSDKSKGVIKIGGSSSMANMVQELADEYMRINPDATVAVVTTDSGDGINGALKGEYDIGMASRNLTDYEKELLETKKLAEDEIVVIVNQKNPIKYLSKEELVDIYSGTITSWETLKGEK